MLFPLRLTLAVSLFTATGAFAQSTVPTPAPGLRIPDGSRPYAFDHFVGKPQLVPIHRSNVEVNNHKGANVVGSLAGSVFYKPKMTTEVAGLHAKTILHDTRPSIYVRLPQSSELQGDDPQKNIGTWSIVRATPAKDRRVFAKVQFTQLTGNAKRADGVVEATAETLPDGWLKLTPVAAMEPGEYAVQPIFKVQNTFSTSVFDFAIDPAGANDEDAIAPHTEE